MKKVVAAAVAALSFACVTFAEQLDHWELTNSSMTDGEWTITCGQRSSLVPGTSDIYELYWTDCTVVPTTPSTLNLAKPVSNTVDSTKYALTRIAPWGGFLTADEKAAIARLVLPTNFELQIAGTFQNCTNLTEVIPLLPSNCVYVVGQCFEGCTKLASPVVLHADTQIDGLQYIFHNTAIPSADLTDSTVTDLNRGVFGQCPNLKIVKLPTTLTKIDATVGPFAGCPALERVEFHSFPTGLNNGFRHTYSSWDLDANLTEIHFYDCAPTAAPDATVFQDVANGKMLTTYLHDMSAEQLQAWGVYCAEGGAITTTSTWNQNLVGKKIYTTRPLVEYSEQHVQIAAGNDAVVLDGQNGTFTVSRGASDPCVGDLVVNYAVSGDAEAGIHYAALPGSVTISNGQASATISVVGLYTGTAFEKGLTLTLTSGDYVLVEGKTNASISITSGYREVSVSKIKDANKELGQVGIFRVSRGDGDSTAGNLTVNLSYSGTAANGTTYRTVPTSVTIPAGKAYEDFEIFPLDDASVTADSEAVISIASGLYTPMGDSATVTIAYGNGVWGCWRIFDDGGTKKITDGTWTFKCKFPGDMVSTGDAYAMNVESATVWPTEVSPLDFTKGFDYVYNNRTYKILNWSMKFGSISDNGKVTTPTEAGDKVGKVTLSGGAHTSSLSDYVFTGCTNMVFDLSTMPTNITTIGKYAFSGSSATGAFSSLNLQVVQDGTFRRCPGITSFNAPRVTSVNTYAFTDATGLTSVDFGTDADCVLASVGGAAFQGCTALESFRPFLPTSCVSIGDHAFTGCSKLSIPLVYTGTAQFIEWGIFQDSGITSVDLSNSGVTNVNRACFAGCTSLTNVSFPACLRVLEGGMQPFTGCTALEKVEFRSVVNLNVFGEYTSGPVYPGCTSLSEVHFYGCVPQTAPVHVYNGANAGMIVTYLHISEAQEPAWAQYTQGGELTANSTWSKACADNNYANRALVKYAAKHVQIEAGLNAVVLDGQNGSFIVSRGDDESSAGDRVVNYEIGGNAEPGTHYAALTGSVTIPSGRSNATISVSGLYTGAAFEKNLTLTLTAGDYEIVEGKSSATITITSGYRSAGVTKIKDANKELGQVGIFRVSRGDGDSTAGNLTVNLSYSGTAGNGTTYRTVPTSVTIPAGKTYEDFEIFPLDDASVTADSEAIISIASGLYTPTGDSATVTITYGNGVWGCWRIFDDAGQKKITDGTWTFKCTLNGVKVSTEDAYRLDVKEATAWPNKVSPLDFTKGFACVYGNTTYKIGIWNMQFGDKATIDNTLVAVPTPAGDMVGAVKLSDGLHAATIADNAFTGCTNMVFDLADFPTNITAIGTYAFFGSSITGSLVAPNLTQIKENAFRACKGISSVVAEKVTTINGSAFLEATGLISVDFGPDSDCVLSFIGSSAFQGCTSLESFTPFLPSSLKVLNQRSAFLNCSSLTNALVFTGSNLGEDTGWDGTQIFMGCAKIPSVDLSGSTITALRREIFANCTSLEWVKLPSTLKEFGYAADTSTLLNRNPFGGDMAVKLYLSATNMPNHTMNIPEITLIEFTTNLTTIAAGAFASTNYSNLVELKFCGAKPATIGENLFTGRKTGAITAYVPFKYVESWKTVADDQIITSTSGTWTSGTTQKIRTKRGLVIFFE